MLQKVNAKPSASLDYSSGCGSWIKLLLANMFPATMTPAMVIMIMEL